MRNVKTINPVLVVSSILLFVIVAYMSYNISNSSQNLFSVSVFALFAGLLFESFRISDDWIPLLVTFLLLFVICFHPFLTGYEYSFYNQNNVNNAPYVFISFGALFLGLYVMQNPTRQIYEGITLIQSLAIVYWIVGNNLFNSGSWFVIIGALIALFCAAFSMFTALTYYTLSNNIRVILSVWSAVVMLFFAFDNIFQVYESGLFTDSHQLYPNMLISLRFFFLGISSIYVVSNFFLVISFLPSSKTFFNATYFKGINELKELHLLRYSDEQSWIGHAILCIIVTGLFYWSNYKYQFLPIHTAIWVGLWLFPILFRIVTFRQKKTTNNYYKK